MKRRIAIGLEYPIGLRGGVSVLVQSLINGLSSEFDVFLLSPDESLVELPEHTARKLAGHWQWAPKGRIGSSSYATTAQMAVAWMLGERIQLLHLHCGGVYGWGNRYPFCSLARAAARAGVSVFWTDHLVVSPTSGICGTDKPSWFKGLLLPLSWLGKMDQLLHVRKEIAVSDHDSTKLRRWYWPLRRRFCRIYHSRLSEVDSLHRPNVSHNRNKSIVNVGHVAFRKGQHILTEAFARIAPDHPEWSLIMVGHDGGDGCWQRIERIRKDSHLESRITLLGKQDDVMSLMQNASIYVQPSLEEALGLALQEALYHGCPAIGSSVGGIPELIQNDVNGLLVTPGRADLLAEALETLVCNPDLRRRYSIESSCVLRSKKMSQSVMVSAYKDLYISKGDA